MRTPKDRRMEVEFQIRLRQQRTTAERMIVQADNYDEEGQDNMKHANSMLPALSLSVRCHKYYFDRLELSRTQWKIEEEFGNEYFMNTLRKKTTFKKNDGLEAMLATLTIEQRM